MSARGSICLSVKWGLGDFKCLFLKKHSAVLCWGSMHLSSLRETEDRVARQLVWSQSWTNSVLPGMQVCLSLAPHRWWPVKPPRGSWCCTHPHSSRGSVLIDTTQASGFVSQEPLLAEGPPHPVGVQMAPPHPLALALPSPPLCLLGTDSSTPSVFHQAEPVVGKCPQTHQGPQVLGCCPSRPRPVDECSLKRIRLSKDPKCLGGSPEHPNNRFKKFSLPSAISHLNLAGTRPECENGASPPTSG